MRIMGKDAEKTTRQKVQRSQLCNTCNTSVKAQIRQKGERAQVGMLGYASEKAQVGMLGNAPDRIAGHRGGCVPRTHE